jgi:dTDP-4-dehydrorhamnose reductase
LSWGRLAVILPRHYALLLETTNLKILLLDPDSQPGFALAELLRRHPQMEWRGVAAATLAQSTEKVVELVTDFVPDFIVNTYSIGLTEFPGDLHKSHVKQLKAICRAANGVGAALVHVSSALVFNNARGKLFFETDRPKPKGPTSRRLVELEQVVTRRTQRHIVLRSGWLFGAHGWGAFHRFLRALELGEEIKLQAAIEGTPTPAADVARVLFAMLQQLDCGAPCWGIYHYCSSEITSSRDFSETVLTMIAQYGKISIESIKLVENGDTSEDHLQRYPILDCNKILNTFGIKQRPWRSAMTGILKTIYQERKAEDPVATA